jgi:hypothetical protein
VLVDDFLQIFFPWFIAFEKKLGRFRERPPQMGVADLLTGGTAFLAV